MDKREKSLNIAEKTTQNPINKGVIVRDPGNLVHSGEKRGWVQRCGRVTI